MTDAPGTHGATRSTSSMAAQTPSIGAATVKVLSNSMLILAVAVSVLGADRLGDRFERLHAMPAAQRVDVGHGGDHARRQRAEAGRGRAGVDPDDAVGQAREALHLLRDERRVAALPAVGEHDD